MQGQTEQGRPEATCGDMDHQERYPQALVLGEGMLMYSQVELL